MARKCQLLSAPKIRPKALECQRSGGLPPLCSASRQCQGTAGALHVRSGTVVFHAPWVRHRRMGGCRENGILEMRRFPTALLRSRSEPPSCRLRSAEAGISLYGHAMGERDPGDSTPLAVERGLQVFLSGDTGLQKEHQQDSCLLRRQVVAHHRAGLHQGSASTFPSIVRKDAPVGHARAYYDRHE